MAQRGKRITRRIDQDRRRLGRRRCASLSQVRGRTGRDGITDEVVTVALGDDRHEQLSRDQGSRIVGRTVDGHVITDESTVHHRRDL